MPLLMTLAHFVRIIHAPILMCPRKLMRLFRVFQQAESFNDGLQLHHGVLVKLLIANAGSTAADTKQVAQQIVRLAQVDKTFVGVMGWPFSGYAAIAVRVLGPAHIPMISETASSDALTNASPY